MQKNKKIIVHIILPMLLGTLLYLLFRPKSILIFDYLKVRHLDKPLNIWRSQLAVFKPFEWVIFSLPGGLWLYSYTYAIGLSWKNVIDRKNIFWYILPLFVSIGSEFGQYFKLVKGTFDWHDIVLYALFTAIALLLLKPKIRLLSNSEDNTPLLQMTK